MLITTAASVYPTGSCCGVAIYQGKDWQSHDHGDLHYFGGDSSGSMLTVPLFVDPRHGPTSSLPLSLLRSTCTLTASVSSCRSVGVLLSSVPSTCTHGRRQRRDRAQSRPLQGQLPVWLEWFTLYHIHRSIVNLKVSLISRVHRVGDNPYPYAAHGQGTITDDDLPGACCCMDKGQSRMMTYPVHVAAWTRDNHG